MTPSPSGQLARPNDEGGINLEAGVQFLWARRRSLLLTTLTLAVVATAVALWQQRGQAPAVSGGLFLSFPGIEKHEYPSGRTFDPLAITAPDVLASAIRDLGFEARTTTAALMGGTSLVPQTPSWILERWKAQDREGRPRDEYLPSQFQLTVSPGGFSTEERIAIFNAIVRSYRDKARREMYARELFLPGYVLAAGSTGDLDYWEVPKMFTQALRGLREAVLIMIHASATSPLSELPVPPGEAASATASPTGLPGVPPDDRNAVHAQAAEVMADRGIKLSQMPRSDAQKYVLFSDLYDRIVLFERNEVAALAGYTYGRRLVKDKAIQVYKAEYRRSQAAIELATRREEAKRTAELMSRVDRPQFVFQGPGGSTSRPLEITSDVVSFLLKSDYYADLVRQAMGVEKEAVEREVEVDEIDKEIALLRSAPVTLPNALPPEYGRLREAAASGLQSLVSRYQRLVDELVDVTVTSAVTVRAGPAVERQDSLPPRTVAALILLASAVGAILLVYVEHFVRHAIASLQEARQGQQ